MDFIFDGETAIITPVAAPTNGTIDVDVRDLYSRWVDWLLMVDNSKYLQAMRVVGGDQLPGSKQLGLTYFLMNGWKIRPYEAAHTFNLNGNIYSEDGSSPYVPTIGNYNVTIINSVSNLVDSTVQQLPEIEYASYNGGITIDAINGTDSYLYPYGTPLYPCKTAANAYAIRVSRGFTTIYLKSDFYVAGLPDGILDGLTIIGKSGFSESAYLLTIDNVLATNCKAYNTRVIGNFKPGSTIETEDCILTSVSNVHLHASNCVITGGVYTSTELHKCQIDGSIEVASGGVLSGINIVFNGDFTTITLIDGTGTISLDIDSGYFELLNAQVGSLAEFNVRGGEIEINENCTGGDLYIEGYGKLYNNGTMSIKANNLMTKDIWDSKTSDYQIAGTTGKALTSAGAAGDPWTGEIPGTYVDGQAGYILDQIRILTEELHKIQGLDINNPLTITQDLRTAGNIDLELTGDKETLTVVTRK